VDRRRRAGEDLVRGRERRCYRVLHHGSRKGQTLVPDWKIEQDGWVIEVAGRPSVTMKVGFLPPPDFEATTLEEFMVLGHIMTATPPLNAILAVVAAAPGIVTYNDLPLILPRGVVPTG
jgi:hypothetical protein